MRRAPAAGAPHRERCTRACAAGGPRLIAFHDWEALTSYESEARTALTTWGFDIRSGVERVHILVRSKLVRMGVSVASIVLVGMIVAHGERTKFDRELFAALAARKPGPFSSR